MNIDVLSMLIWLPIIAGAFLVMTPMPRWFSRIMGIAAAAVALFFAFGLFSAPFGDLGAVLVERTLWIEEFGIAYHVGLEGVALPMLLAVCVFMPMLHAGLGPNCGRGCRGLLLIAQGGAIGTLVAQDLVVFLMFWGLVGMTFAFLVGIQSVKGRRSAAIGLAGSWTLSMLLMFTVIVVMAVTYRSQTGDWSLAISDLQLTVLDDLQMWILGGLSVAAFFLVLPVAPFHGWYINALAEAPLAGAAVVTAISGRLAAVALVRIVFPLFPSAVSSIAMYVALAVLAGSVLLTLSSLAASNVRRRLGAVSAADAGIAAAAIFCLNGAGLTGGLVLAAAGGVMMGCLVLMRWPCLDDEPDTPGRAPMFAVAGAVAIGIPGSMIFVGYVLAFTGLATLGVTAILLVGAAVVILGAAMVSLIRASCDEPLHGRTPMNIAAALVLVAVIVLAGVFPGPLLDRVSPGAIRAVDILKARTDHAAANAAAEVNR